MFIAHIILLVTNGGVERDGRSRRRDPRDCADSPDLVLSNHLFTSRPPRSSSLRAMRAWAACAFSAPHVTPWLASRAGLVARSCAAKADTLGEHTADAEVAQNLARPSPPVLLRDLFSPKRSGQEWSGAGKKRALHRLDRLQEVANLALEDRAAPGGEPWSCADIGADHGLLAICLHANGANVIAGDRATGPLSVARENVRLYLRQAQEEISSAIAAPTAEGASLVRSRSNGLFDADAEAGERPVQGVMSEGAGGDGVVAAVNLPRLECRLGDGLAVLEEDEVDTVCIAGVGVKTMIQIIGAHDGGRIEGDVDKEHSKESRQDASLLSRVGVRRLVLQPMDARLEYMRDLRIWLRENGWRITQETIVSTLGKGGNHAFLTLRADFVGSSEDLESDQGQHWLSDWLGGVLPARATALRGERRQEDLQEAATFVAYLRHQRDWLRAIERARSPSADKSSGTQGASISEGVDEVLSAIEDAIRASGEDAENHDAPQPLVTARRWRRSAG